MRTTCQVLLLLAALALMITAMTVLLAPTVEAQGKPKADLSRLVIVGDSISAGHQNSSLMAAQQVNGYASLIAAQAGVELPLPLISYPGFPPVLEIKDPGPPPVIGPVDALPGTRIDPAVQPFNLSVPGARVVDALYRGFDSPFHGPFPFPTLSNLVLGPELNAAGQPKSMVEWAEELQPTTALVWLGSNDILWAAIFADSRFITPEPVFAQAYHELMSRMAATGATLVTANLPAIATIPFLTPAETVEAVTGVPLAYLGLAPGDFVTPNAYGFIQAGVLPLPDDLDVYGVDVVVRAAEIDAMNAATAAFNAIIAAEAAAYGVPVVDMHAVLSMVHDYGLVVNGHRLTTDFLGGVFTLDGIHPTNTGHAVIANEFIRVLNRHHAAGIPPVSVQQIAAEDPFIYPGLGQPAASFNALTHAAMEGIDGGMGQ